MNIYLVKVSSPDLALNTRYFFLDSNLRIDGDTVDFRHVLLVTNDYRFASYCGKSYRVCQLELEDDDDNPFVKVWERDPFAGFEGYPPLPEDDLPEYVI